MPGLTINQQSDLAMTERDRLRADIRRHRFSDETELVGRLAERTGLSATERNAIASDAARLVRAIRAGSRPTVMESFLSEYGLSSEEGVGLMCLAEALLRVPDAETIDDLISDKIEPSNWGAHLGASSSSLVNASTWALMLTGKVLHEGGAGPAAALRDLIRRAGEPVVRTAVGQAMRLMGQQFVLGETIEKAMNRARSLQDEGYTYSYDMLGEAARTFVDAARYKAAYADAIRTIAAACTGDVRDNPGISVKLSALHPRYEYTHRAEMMRDLVPVVLKLAKMARDADLGFNIDAEEADRLDLSLDVIEAVLSDPSLAGWSGFGVVVQAYGRRALPVLDWLHALATDLDRQIMVRLVKGAYWDTEIKRAQELGVAGFPVFTRKAATDVSYLAAARSLLEKTDRIYPQFATHNAHTVAAVLAMAEDKSTFEFQRLHGMGEALHDAVMKRQGTRCRVYAPVGAHRDLLAYLVRRLLENGANSSFVNQIVNTAIAPEDVARDPISELEAAGERLANPGIRLPRDLFQPERINARGYDLNDPDDLEFLDRERSRFASYEWHAGRPGSSGPNERVVNPARPDETVGHVVNAGPDDIERALEASSAAAKAWAETPVRTRAEILRRAADLYETHTGEFLALATREAGKTLLDGVAEIREAVDFLRYYASRAERLNSPPRGVFVCISPWNFPLAIFSGQIAAALATGNAVIAKPAEQTPLIAARAVALLHEAGVPEKALCLLPGNGPDVGAALVADPRVDGVCFTGSTEVAQIINRAMAANLSPDAPLIAETGGLNAMIVDSTALPEQAVRDILASSFQSAGQRCSALRILYVQKDVADRLVEMLSGAMDALTVGDPWLVPTDVGPVIDAEAHGMISNYCARGKAAGRLMKTVPVPENGLFCAPTIIRVDGIADMEREIFGPVLHVATFAADDLEAVVDDINARGYGLTLGLHTRIDDRVQAVVERARVGNTYVNRNQIGAIVGSQPFGGEGLSGTGPKAGGPLYLSRFTRPGSEASTVVAGQPADAAAIQTAIDRCNKAGAVRPQAERIAALRRALGPVPRRLVAGALEAAAGLVMATGPLPGPTGESNRYGLWGRGTALCLGPELGQAMAQAVQALATGGAAVVIVPEASEAITALAEQGLPVAAVDGVLEAAALETLTEFDLIASMADPESNRALRLALSARPGPILPLVTEAAAPERYVVERHLCIDTTAAGGNASLLAAAEAPPPGGSA